MAVPLLGALGMVARAQLRRRWLSLLAIGLLVGFVGAVIGGAASVARRTATAHERLERATNVADLQIVLAPVPELAARAASVIPDVQAVWVTSASVARLDDRRDVVYIGALSGHAVGSDTRVYTPIVIEGRDFDPDAAEATIDEDAARGLGLGVGDTVPLRMLTLANYNNFDTGFGEPGGPRITVTITGITRMAGDARHQTPLILSPAAAQAAPPVKMAVLIRLAAKPGAVARAEQALAAAAEAARADRDPDASEWPEFEISHPATDSDPRAAATSHVVVTGLVTFAIVVAVTGLATAGAAFGRHHDSGRADQRIESTLGLPLAGRVGARLIATVPAALLAGVFALLGPVIVGAVSPVGPLAVFEPHPGYAVNLTVAAVTGLGAACAVQLLSAWSAFRANRHMVARDRTAAGNPRVRPARGRAARRGPAWVWVGVRFAGGLYRPAVVRRPAVLAVGLAVAALVAAGTVDQGINRLRDDPGRYGWSADLRVFDARPEVVQALKADPRIGAINIADKAAVRVGADCPGVTAVVEGGWGAYDGCREISAFSIIKVPAKGTTSPEGARAWTILSGRQIGDPTEMVIGIRAARALHVGLGDKLVVAPGPGGGQPARLTVVGIGIGPPISGERLGDSVLVAPQVLDRTQLTTPWRDALVAAADGVSVDELAAELGVRYEVDQRRPPPEIANLDGIGRLPELLQLVLGTLAAGALGHTVLINWRRRLPEVAVLRTLGSTPGQTAAAAAAAAAATALATVVVGIPLGLGIGRLAWWEIAAATGVGGDTAIPMALLLALPAATAGMGILAVLAPAAIRRGWLTPSMRSGGD
ncbi:ABC transporter permease [Frankia sp. CNm7]|uniref:ABC transporter permease n=1 Tax=Frankia nepalensis TaxID=1836974 RepID=A0A937RI95_9ACTN|nr:ABC transporter permease [Frankia nepalensis]MBL7500697.1 ABC transporter permease [Frankia nepalensis]MBL7515692.1 ABC transporter permease [Frankia nepalensis]MBL7519669.1 ABC transporter permease [Frankia nepalensis]MBL7632751.1 ABC transporter permease [Frankia nepalensis]